MIIMKNFNRRNSHGHHGSKCRELAQHAHSSGSHAFTHTLSPTQLQPSGAKHQLSYYRIWNQIFILKVSALLGHRLCTQSQEWRMGNDEHLFLIRMKRMKYVERANTAFQRKLSSGANSKMLKVCHFFFSSTAPVYLSYLLSVYSPSGQLRSSSDPRILCIPSCQNKQIRTTFFFFCCSRCLESSPAWSPSHSVSYIFQHCSQNSPV